MLDLIKFENNYVSYVFENKMIKNKDRNTYDDSYFCGIDVCTILEHKNIKTSLFKLDDDYKKILKQSWNSWRLV